MKRLAGNPGRRRLPKNEPKPAPGVPLPPASVLEDQIALLEWNRIVPMLLKMGVLAKVHMAALAAYCNSFSQWQRAEEAIRKHGTFFSNDKGDVKKHPAVTIGNHAKAHLRAFMIEFGITPAAQSRINASSSEETDKQTKAKRFFGD